MSSSLSPIPLSPFYTPTTPIPTPTLSAPITPTLKLVNKSKRDIITQAAYDMDSIKAERCKRSFSYFLSEFWSEISNEVFKSNWHIEVFCNELQHIAEIVAKGLPKEHDLIVNVSPGTTKTITFSIAFPVWCWINWHWMRFITTSYSSALSLESAEYSRDLIRSEKFGRYFPELDIKPDKDTKSNFRVQKMDTKGKVTLGGNRYSTSIGGTLTGFHGHILIVDDPLDPNRAFSPVEVNKANRWIDQTLSTRKVDKAVTPTILVMQRLAENDPSGYLLSKEKTNVKHICLPGQIRDYKEYLKPKAFESFYIDDLFDPIRMPWAVLKDMEADLGQYGFAGQVGQNPTPPSGGMFKIDKFIMIDKLPSEVNFVKTVRYWDKAGTDELVSKDPDYTVGVKMSLLKSGKYIVHDVVRGRWESQEREAKIKDVAEADGPSVIVWVEQEPGSGGKESAQATIRNLAGYSAHRESPVGNKIARADTLSVQVNEGNVMLLKGEWNAPYKTEIGFFPFSKHKDQTDATSGAFRALGNSKNAGMLF